MTDGNPMALLILNQVNSALASHNRGTTMNHLYTASESIGQDRPATPTESALSQLENSAVKLLDLLDSHEGLINMCLRGSMPPAPSGSGACAKAVPDSSLLDRLGNIQARINVAHARIEDLSARVTL
jgi:hypothetical protein